MAHSIGLAGKGGTGKTTLAGLLVKYLVEGGNTPVLAVDADANSNLNEVLGLQVKETLGGAREEMKKDVPTGMTKDIYMEMKLQEAIVEAAGFDLVVMGRPEGAGCYCAANTLLTTYLDRLIANYKFVVIDNEAGMEHISRLTTNNIDILLIVSDPTRRGIQAAARINALTEELGLNIGDIRLVVNRTKQGQQDPVEEMAEKYNLTVAGTLPENQELQEADLKGIPTVKLGVDNEVVKAAYDIFDKIIVG